MTVPLFSVLLLLLPVATPAVAGWFVVRYIWPEAPAGLRASLGTAVGLGIAGTVYCLVLLVTNSARWALIASEAVLLSSTIGAIGLARPNRLKFRSAKKRLVAVHSIELGAWSVTCALGAAAFVFALDALRHGGWDAVVMWNMRARFLATAEAPMTAIFDSVFLGLHPDYPLLLPALVSRGWQYAGGILGVPVLLAATFLVATSAIAMTGLRVVSTTQQAWIGGVLLLGTPYFLAIGASQYADIVVSGFMTAAIVVYSIYDFHESANRRLPFIAGIAAAGAACTKNEGMLFLILLAVSRVVAAVRSRRVTHLTDEFVALIGGASLGIVTLGVFKLAYAPSNDTVPLLPFQPMLHRLIDLRSHRQVWNGIRASLNFGRWRLSPLPVIAIHTAVAWPAEYSRRKISPSFTPAFVVVTLLCSYYLVYLLSPYDLESHVVSSLDRLLIQLWPVLVLLYCMMVAPQRAVGSFKNSRRVIALRAAALLLAIALTATAVWRPQVDADSKALGIKPTVELSRTEVAIGDTYEMRISGIRGPQVFVSYSLDGKPMGQFGAYLGADRSVDFQITSSTPKGTYRFVAVRTADANDWREFDTPVEIVVR